MASKFRNVRVTIDGVTFDSKGEAARYTVLRQREATGLIENLRLQVPYTLTVNGMKVCTYRADFVYDQGGSTITEDFKGVITATYRLKSKLMKAVHGITIKEVKKPDAD